MEKSLGKKQELTNLVEIKIENSNIVIREENQMDKAVKWYEELFAMTNDLEPIYYYRFGEALKNTGETKRGDAMIVRFNQMVR